MLVERIFDKLKQLKITCIFQLVHKFRNIRKHNAHTQIVSGLQCIRRYVLQLHLKFDKF